MKAVYLVETGLGREVTESARLDMIGQLMNTEWQSCRR